MRHYRWNVLLQRSQAENDSQWNAKDIANKHGCITMSSDSIRSSTELTVIGPALPVMWMDRDDYNSVDGTECTPLGDQNASLASPAVSPASVTSLSAFPATSVTTLQNVSR